MLTVGILSAFSASRKAAAAPPEAGDWNTVQSMTKLLSFEVPGNWKFVTAGSSGSYEQAEARASKLCFVSVNGTGTKGALGDVAGAAARVSGTDSGGDISLRSEAACTPRWANWSVGRIEPTRKAAR